MIDHLEIFKKKQEEKEKKQKIKNSAIEDLKYWIGLFFIGIPCLIITIHIYDYWMPITYVFGLIPLFLFIGGLIAPIIILGNLNKIRKLYGIIGIITYFFSIIFIGIITFFYIYLSIYIWNQTLGLSTIIESNGITIKCSKTDPKKGDTVKFAFKSRDKFNLIVFHPNKNIEKTIYSSSGNAGIGLLDLIYYSDLVRRNIFLSKDFNPNEAKFVITLRTAESIGRKTYRNKDEKFTILFSENNLITPGKPSISVPHVSNKKNLKKEKVKKN